MKPESYLTLTRIARAMPGGLRLAASWLLYGVGHAVSIPMLRWDLAFLYPLYNSAMVASDAIQGDLKPGPWGPPAEDDHGSTGPPLRS